MKKDRTFKQRILIFFKKAKVQGLNIENGSEKAELHPKAETERLVKGIKKKPRKSWRLNF